MEACIFDRPADAGKPIFWNRATVSVGLMWFRRARDLWFEEDLCDYQKKKLTTTPRCVFTANRKAGPGASTMKKEESETRPARN